MLQV
ncbi:dihydrolipoyllysine-residue acetyltransferase domain protein, partial [Vibrio cholerae CP1044(17)]|jgi:hypothetical protein